MNKLPTAKRAQIIRMLVEGISLRAISRVEDVSINTVSKLLVEAGEACIDFHNNSVRNVNSKRVQVDEIWQFCYAKGKNVSEAKAAPEGAGDTWTWTALDSDSKLIVSWLLGERDQRSAYHFIADLAERLAGRVQLTSDGLRLYRSAVEAVFGSGVDYAQVVKIFGAPTEGEKRYSPVTCQGAVRSQVQGRPDPDHISTSYVERHNLTMRMSMRRFTRLTNAFSKKLRNHALALALYFVHYNFCRRHKTIRVTPAMEAGLDNMPRDAEWIVGLVDAAAPKPAKPGPKPGSKRRAMANQTETLPESQDALDFTLYEAGTLLETKTMRLEGGLFFSEIFDSVGQHFIGSVRVVSQKPFFITVLRQELIPGPQLRFQLTSVPATPVP